MESVLSVKFSFNLAVANSSSSQSSLFEKYFLMYPLISLGENPMSSVWLATPNKSATLFSVSLDKVRTVAPFKIFPVTSFFNKAEKGIFSSKLSAKSDSWHPDFGSQTLSTTIRVALGFLFTKSRRSFGRSKETWRRIKSSNEIPSPGESSRALKSKQSRILMRDVSDDSSFAQPLTIFWAKVVFPIPALPVIEILPKASRLSELFAAKYLFAIVLGHFTPDNTGLVNISSSFKASTLSRGELSIYSVFVE